MSVPNSKFITAQAHLYAGIAKADGEVSKKEYAQVPYYAERAQKFFEKNPLSSKRDPHIGLKIREILSLPKYRAWKSIDHLNEAEKIIKQARTEGLWNVEYAVFKNEKGFLDAAKIDGYVIKEATFIRKMEEILGAE